MYTMTIFSGDVEIVFDCGIKGRLNAKTKAAIVNKLAADMNNWLSCDFFF